MAAFSAKGRGASCLCIIIDTALINFNIPITPNAGLRNAAYHRLLTMICYNFPKNFRHFFCKILAGKTVLDGKFFQLIESSLNLDPSIHLGLESRFSMRLSTYHAASNPLQLINLNKISFSCIANKSAVCTVAA